MIDVLSVENMRESDANTIGRGVPGTELMKRAALGIFESVEWNGKVAVVCGSGNNAGDGYALALILAEHDVDVTLILIYDRFSDDGRYYYDRCVDSEVKIIMLDDDTDLSGYDIIVDCLLGTGFKGKVREEIEAVIKKINSSNAYIVSADINSGLDGNSGISRCCVRSDMTVSIGSFKPGHFLNMAKDVMGQKTNCDIGIEPVWKPYRLIEKQDIAKVFKPRMNYSNKGTYGYVALIGGSLRYSGAIRLAYMANAAMRSGAGVVKVGVAGSLTHDVASHILESTLFPMKDDNGNLLFDRDELEELTLNVRTVAFGMGIGVTDDTERILGYLLENFRGRLIIDADGLTLLAKMDRERIRKASGRLILTPHIKEFSRLTGLTKDKILENPIDAAKDYALDTNTILLLKGPATVVTDGDEVYITETGCPGMATGGSGDVLSGILSATCAYIEDEMSAVCAGAYINGAAGMLAQDKKGAVSMIASDTVEHISEVIKNL